MLDADQRRTMFMSGTYIRVLGDHENALAELYRLFAAALTQSREFWLIIAAEEDSHKRLIDDMTEKFRSGELTFNRPNFKAYDINDSIDYITQIKARIKIHGISMREALKIAIELECGIIESAFFQVVDGDDPKIVEFLLSQSTRTKNHVSLRKEGKRLKWKFLGGTRQTLLRADQLSRDDLQLSIRTNQIAILGMLASLEETIGHIYSTFSRRIKDSEDFWQKMAAEEMTHAAMIRKLYSVLDKGNVFYNIDNFNRRALETFLDTALSAEFEAKHGTLTRHKAMNIALKMEHNLAGKEFYKTVKSDAPEFKVIATRMAENIDKHIHKIELEAGRLIDIGSLASEPLPLLSQPKLTK